jgi:hypothetical protein
MVSFQCYDPSADGTGGVHAWYGALLGSSKAAVDTTLETIASETNLADVPETLLKPLRRKCSGLSEVIVEVDTGTYDARKKRRVYEHIRVLCVEGPGRNEITLLHGFSKRGGPDYGPACHTAHRRNEGIERDGIRRAQTCAFP